MRFNAGENPFDNGLGEINSAINYLDSGEIDTSETIQQAMTMLNELDEICTNILAICTQALGSQAKVFKAIANASRAIDTYLTSGQLYTLASQLHTDHQKPELAIDVLEKGLRSVLLSEYPHSMNNEKQRNDTTILGWLRDMNVGNKEIFGWTMMSRKWRASVLGCAQLWEVVKYNKGANVAFQLLPSVYNYVEELNIKNLPKHQSQAFRRLAAQGALQSATKLLDRDILSNIPLRLMSALEDQIAELDLDITPGFMGRQNNVLVLDDILEPRRI
ncbi:hypothetical protein BJV82DRAFT_716815 [Fennellomyces sp. T-0311]|nr:hypothetical protein BJV82DRAFT_716815 [Fennellomyces sp. T-0311]